MSTRKPDAFGCLEHTRGEISVQVPTLGLSLPLTFPPHPTAWLGIGVHTDEAVQRARGAWCSHVGSSQPFQELNARLFLLSPFIGGWDVEIPFSRGKWALADPSLAHDAPFSPVWALAALLPAAAQ